ncbi:hypothetical protein AGMMS49938_08650 [Fibrobacterales bacterium]|nr:hypothetical protein AGMMS49938_08650 [Fibrobacterales bacterium]
MNKDRIIGYITIVVLLAAVGALAFLMWEKEERADKIVFVQFSEMGALQNEDIVTIRGYTVGKIAAITKGVSGKALVKIVLDEPRVFRKDAKFINISPDIMGSRSVRIELCRDERNRKCSDEPAPENFVFDGKFEPGFAEVLQLANVAKDQVALIMEVVRELYTGNENNPPLQKKVESILAEFENLIWSVGGVIALAERDALSAVGKVGIYSAQIANASDQINRTLDSLRVQATNGIVGLESIVANIEIAIDNLNKILVEFYENPVTISLVDEKVIINDIDSLVASLQTFLKSIDQYGLILYDEDGKRKSMVSMGNIHLIRETARSKARKQSENP